MTSPRNPFAALLLDRLRTSRSSRQLRGATFREFCDAVGFEPWAKQLEVADAIERGDPKVNVKTGHGVGKTSIAGHLACWALASWEPTPLVITTAPTFRQVKDLLWKEIRSCWARSPLLYPAMGEALTTEIKLRDGSGYAKGFSTADGGKFQGLHHPRMFFVIDEANEVKDDIHDAVEHCGVSSGVQVLKIGNPVLPYGRFFEEFGSAGVTKITISCREHPNVVEKRDVIRGAVTDAWIKDFCQKHEHRPDVIRSRVDGDFPESSDRALLSRALLDACLVKRKVATDWPRVIAVDVARYGVNMTVATRLHGQAMMGQRRWTRTSVPHTFRELMKMHHESPVDAFVVDDDGVGGGVTDMLAEANMSVTPFRSGQPADDPDRFQNMSAEAWWSVRELAENGTLLLHDLSHELAVQLTSREWELRGGKKIFIESKEDYCDRTGMMSPDDADSLAMGCWYLRRMWAAAVA